MSIIKPSKVYTVLLHNYSNDFKNKKSKTLNISDTIEFMCKCKETAYMYAVKHIMMDLIDDISYLFELTSIENQNEQKNNLSYSYDEDDFYTYENAVLTMLLHVIWKARYKGYKKYNWEDMYLEIEGDIHTWRILKSYRYKFPGKLPNFLWYIVKVNNHQDTIYNIPYNIWYILQKSNYLSKIPEPDDTIKQFAFKKYTSISSTYTICPEKFNENNNETLEKLELITGPEHPCDITY